MPSAPPGYSPHIVNPLSRSPSLNSQESKQVYNIIKWALQSAVIDESDYLLQQNTVYPSILPFIL